MSSRPAGKRRAGVAPGSAGGSTVEGIDLGSIGAAWSSMEATALGSWTGVKAGGGGRATVAVAGEGAVPGDAPVTGDGAVIGYIPAPGDGSLTAGATTCP